jgi:hypothetical protein
MSTGGAEQAGLYPPREAARLLEVSGSGLRRLAEIYAEVHGELPRDESTKGERKARLWPAEALERLQKARALVDAKRYGSIRDALEALERGEVAPEASPPAVPPADELRRRVEALAALPGQLGELEARQAEALTLLRDLLAKVERLEQTVSEQQRESLEKQAAELRASARDDEKPALQPPRWQFWRRRR